MKITSTYSVRLRNFNLVFDDTVEVYRHAVDYFIELVMANWNTHFANLSHANDCIRVAEGLSVGVSGFLCLGRLFQGQPNEAALCI